ncbi:MAG: hypothetical protein IE931_00290 [Sphingobacteriales bacterium]|nr:hypothetical protein [Sphingobacteriales bacterium]
MKRIIFALLILSVLQVHGQEIQWVSRVIKSSSDLGGKQYSSRRIVGKPDVFPQAGDSPNAWAPKNAQDGHDFIEVEFEKAQTVKQIAIFENLNSGCLVKVMVGNGNGKYKEIFRNKLDVTYWKEKSKEFNRSYYFSKKRRKVVKAPEVNINPGIEYAILEEPQENVKALRIVFNFKKTEGDKQIDAVGISDNDTKLLPLINSTQELENLAAPQSVYSSPNNFNLDALVKNKIFISMYDETENSKIYTLEQKDNQWTNLNLVSPNLNKNTSYNYIAAITKDQSKLIHGGKPYNRGKTETGFEFFKYDGSDYVFDKNLEIVAYNNFEDIATLSSNKDASILILGVESDITQGALDLYYSKVKEDGTYSFLQNLGKNINSANDESSPFLCDDEKVLLFASNGFSGYGDYDLFYTIRLDDTWKKWSDPINLGAKINSNSSETSMIYDSETENLYYVGYKDDAYHIFKINIPKNLFVAK